MQMIIVIICIKAHVADFNMKKHLVKIAISPNALASLIQKGQIHAVDFRCLDSESKKTVWKLLLSTMKLTVKP